MTSPALPPPDVVNTEALWELLSAKSSKSRGSLDAMYRRFGAILDSVGSAREAVAQWDSLGLEIDSDLFTDVQVERVVRAATIKAAEWSAETWSMLALGTAEYPPQVAEVVDAPPLLFVEGDRRLLSRPGVAVVGTRSATDEGLRRASRAARALVDAGVVVISGMAKGIDAAAHDATLAAGGLTVAVMGTPIDRRYPADHDALSRSIIDRGGALVSEFHPGIATQRWHFLRRNRTMSALAAATLVVEAAETSGARSQALAAIEHGRPVFLPESLVQQHAWARELVEVGRGGVRAIMVESPEAIVTALHGELGDTQTVSF